MMNVNQRANLRRGNVSPFQLCLTLMVALLFGAMPAVAQYRASIQGTVTDAQGAAIPGAVLQLTDVTTNQTSTAKSDARGNYNFNALPANRFKLTVVASGFAARTLDELTLIPEQANTVNVKLQVGGAVASIEVDDAEVPNLDTATASISGTVTDNQIQHLPSFGRDIFRLVALAPGTFGDESQTNTGNAKNLPGSDQSGSTSTDGIFKTENNPQVIANGSQFNANNILIDGISTSSANYGGASFITPTEDSVQYLKVTANAYDAEFGRFSGAAIQITSKSGTNSYHGSGFFKADRAGLNAYQRWNGQNTNDPSNAGKTAILRGLQRDTSKFNQFGGSVGGPLLHNRIFTFFAYETLRAKSVGQAQNIYTTPAFALSARPGSNAAAYLNLVGGGVAGTPINGSCSLLGLAEGSYCKTVNLTAPDGTIAQGIDVGSPLKLAPGINDPSYSSNTKPGIGSGLDGVADLEYVATQNPSTRTASQYNGRFDYDVNHKDRVSFIIYYVPLSTLSYNGPVRPANLFNHSQINQAYTVLENHTFSPSLLNEARVSTGGWKWNEVASNPNAPFGLPQATFANTAPTTQPQAFGIPSPSIFNQLTYGYQDILTKVAGRHNLKAGFNLNHIDFENINIGNARPQFQFYGIWDFLNDAPYQETGTFNPVTGLPATNRQDVRENIAGIFLQDDFRLTPTLTFNAGLRWNYFGPLYDKQNNLSVVVPGQGSALLTGLTLRQGGNLYDVQKGNFGPQVGFAWNPKYYEGKVVVRGGFGINYNEDEFAITINGNSNVPNLLGFAQTGYAAKNANIQYTLPSDIHSVFGFPPNQRAITGFGSNGLPLTTQVNVFGFDQKVKTIQVFHYSFDTELALSRNFVATIGYQGSSGHHLLYQTNLNAYAVAHGMALNSALTGVGFFTNGANSNYNALLTTLKHNFSRDFQVEAQYTWSKSMDEGSSPYAQDPYAPISIHAAYGRSDYNVQNAFRVFGLYQPNFFHERVLHAVADGISIGGIYNWHSGFPWNPTYPVTSTGLVGGPSANLYYKGSPFSSIRPGSYSGAAGQDHSTYAFETGPSNTFPNARNINFPNGGPAYFAPPAYTAVASSTAFSATNIAPLPGPAIERNSFTGPGYQDLDVSLSKGINIPEMRVIGDKARFEVRADMFNVFNLVNLTPSPTTSIVSTSFGANTSALGSRTIEMQARFSF